MHLPNPTLSTGESYRFEKERFFFVLLYFAALSVAARIVHFAPPFILLAPLSLLFVRLNAYRFLVILIAGYVLFFRPGTPGTVSQGLLISDSLTLAFLFMMLISPSSKPGEVRIPFSGTLAGIYALVAYVLVLTPMAVMKYRPEYVLFDLKNFFYFLLIPVLLVFDGSSREPKKFVRLVGTFLIFEFFHSLLVIGEFMITRGRVLTLNEIFISDAVIISLLFLRLPLRTRTIWLLRLALAVFLLALLIVQTRGVWASTAAALMLFYFLDFFQNKNFRVASLLRRAAITAVLFGIADVAVRILSGNSVVGFIKNRLAQGDMKELVDPYSSTGYRLHESWAVWTERTNFGHGPGASLHLFFTLSGKGGFTDWWAIHSGYFEILHKLGFVGLGIVFWLFGSYYFLGRRMTKSPSRTVSVFGAILSTVIVNHAVVSISSGYMFRHGVLMWILLFFIAERLRTPKKRQTAGHVTHQGLTE
jgi:O-antigen ligase